MPRINDRQKHKVLIVHMGNYLTLLLISNVYKTLYFFVSLIQSSQCCQITTIRFSYFEFEKFSPFYTHCIGIVKT